MGNDWPNSISVFYGPRIIENKLYTSSLYFSSSTSFYLLKEHFGEMTEKMTKLSSYFFFNIFYWSALKSMEYKDFGLGAMNLSNGWKWMWHRVVKITKCTEIISWCWRWCWEWWNQNGNGKRRALGAFRNAASSNHIRMHSVVWF